MQTTRSICLKCLPWRSQGPFLESRFVLETIQLSTCSPCKDFHNWLNWKLVTIQLVVLFIWHLLQFVFLFFQPPHHCLRCMKACLVLLLLIDLLALLLCAQRIIVFSYTISLMTGGFQRFLSSFPLCLSINYL